MRKVSGDTKTEEGPLAKKLADQLDEGAVSVSSADLADFSKSKAKSGEDVKGPVSVPAPDLAKKDPVGEAANAAHPEQQLHADMDAGAETQDALRDMVVRGTTSYTQVILTQAEREAFVDALISGERFELPFSLYSGKLEGVVRSRSQAETSAIIRYLNQELRDGNITDMLEYATHLRNILLAAQIKILKDEEYAELAAPLMRTVTGKDANGDEQRTEPGWLGQAELWADKQEGLSAAVYSEIRKFEQKYWAMVDGAEDQNFLNPEESTSE
jgi:hypothetical protein